VILSGPDLSAADPLDHALTRSSGQTQSWSCPGAELCAPATSHARGSADQLVAALANAGVTEVRAVTRDHISDFLHGPGDALGVDGERPLPGPPAVLHVARRLHLRWERLGATSSTARLCCCAARLRVVHDRERRTTRRLLSNPGVVAPISWTARPVSPLPPDNHVRTEWSCRDDGHDSDGPRRQAPSRSLRPTGGCRVSLRTRPTDRFQDNPARCQPAS
jgi:hypothetical protein